MLNKDIPLACNVGKLDLGNVQILTFVLCGKIFDYLKVFWKIVAGKYSDYISR
jgi:hypothetical protein